MGHDFIRFNISFVSSFKHEDEVVCRNVDISVKIVAEAGRGSPPSKGGVSCVSGPRTPPCLPRRAEGGRSVFDARETPMQFLWG